MSERCPWCGTLTTSAGCPNYLSHGPLQPPRVVTHTPPAPPVEKLCPECGESTTVHPSGVVVSFHKVGCSNSSHPPRQGSFQFNPPLAVAPLLAHARAEAERRVAEVEARYAPLVQAVKEWQEANRMHDRAMVDGDPIEASEADRRLLDAEGDLLALPLKEAK